MSITLFISSILISMSSLMDNCPLENAVPNPDISMFVSGVRPNMGISFAGTLGEQVFSVADGEVSKVFKRRGVVYIEADGISYAYIGVEALEQIVIGQKVRLGEAIGRLDGELLAINVSKDGERVRARDYISCACN